MKVLFRYFWQGENHARLELKTIDQLHPLWSWTIWFTIEYSAFMYQTGIILFASMLLAINTERWTEEGYNNKKSYWLTERQSGWALSPWPEPVCFLLLSGLHGLPYAGCVHADWLSSGTVVSGQKTPEPHAT